MLRVLLVVLLFVVLTPAVMAQAPSATYVDWLSFDSAGYTTYTYMLFSSDTEDTITKFHVFAPFDYKLIQEWSADEGWDFEAKADPQTGAADLCWYSATGLSAGGMLMVTLTTPSSILTNEEYKLPECEGNWGFETLAYQGSAPIMTSSIGVPQSEFATPEPGSVIALISGVAALIGYRKRLG